MTPGLSMQILWKLANEEAAAARFERVEPEHLLCAICKFSELETAALGKIAAAASLRQQLQEEREQLRMALVESGIEVPGDTTSMRHRLRERLGRGSGRGGPSGPSEAASDLWRKAGERARDEGKKKTAPVHLLRAVLDSPPDRLAEVLPADGPMSGGGEPAETPALDAHGCELTAGRGEGEAEGAEATAPDDPVARVLIEELAAPGKRARSFVLVQAGRRTPREVVREVARFLPGPGSGDVGVSRRLVRVSISRLRRGPDANRAEAIAAQILREAASDRRLILFLPDLADWVGRDAARPARDLAEALSGGNLTCILGTDEAEYRRHIEGKRPWSELLRPVWIHDLDAPLREL